MTDIFGRCRSPCEIRSLDCDAPCPGNSRIGAFNLSDAFLEEIQA